MTPGEFNTRLQELRTLVADQVTALEENPRWGSEDERLEVVQSLEELTVQVESLLEMLEQVPDEEEAAEE